MLRSRIMSAATAAVLMLGMSVGGASAAFAETDDLVSAVDENVGTETVVEPVRDEPTESTVTPAVVPPGLGDEVGGGGGGGPAPHPDGGATKVAVCHATPPDTAAEGWNLLSIDDDAAATNQSGHDQEHDADIIQAFSYWHKVGNGNDATWEYLSYPGKNLTTDFDGFTGAEILANDCVKPSTPPPPVIYEVGLYLYKKLNPDAPASWPNSGPQTFIDSQLGVDWFTEFPSVLPENVCGEGWAVQQDKVSHTGGFTWPASITYPNDNIGWPPIYDARHDNLETYLEVPDCEPPTLPTINVTASSIGFTCERPSGSFTVGLGLAEENGSKLLWSTSMAGDPVLPGTVPVTEAGVITVTVDVLDEFADEYGLNDESGLGVVDPVTGAITWTFTFTEPDDCELGSVVVPIVTYEDYCEGAGPNALRVATFTVTDVENASYTYTVNGGAPMAVVFNGADTVTIAVNPLDMVVVTATPADGFELNEGYEPWSHSFIGAAFCPGTFPATVAAAEITPGDCEGNGPVVTLTNEGGVIWTLNGQIVAGETSHQLPWGSAVMLTASLEEPTQQNPGGWTWSDPEQQTVWTADGMSEEDCLSSLAYTGTNSATAWIGAAAVLMMIAGMGFVVRRRSVEI
ncbi:hypothetical protein [Microcella sp.]|uniref:hypothetical protein n=1 Tax=Microcella sp. TaxID=1913979 RepID=UPI002561A9F6|nr:hypothetical protein [Microcella sp.]MBX9472071.1 hypothetical protein [Microcella sp.]